jgi:hypothetical protein
MKKYIDEHAQEILEEDKRREQQMVAEQKTSLMGFMGVMGKWGVGPSPPSGERSQQAGK